ncbi:uncharacterized protein [Panulirus ornatus]|uniref:uncharacterized protein n=1 Tax=Panulirus ornatus TaxID=150431 RepID=UPI003A8422AB
MTALLRAWRSLYTVTLPLLLALMAPLKDHNIREDVLSTFRDTVLPYADLPGLIDSQPRAFIDHHWKLKQMMLLLASVGPCVCSLTLPVTHENQPLRNQHNNKINDISEVLSKVLSREVEAMSLTASVFHHLVHLHHGGRPDQQLQLLHGQFSPHQWLHRIQ